MTSPAASRACNCAQKHPEEIAVGRSEDGPQAAAASPGKCQFLREYIVFGHREPGFGGHILIASWAGASGGKRSR